MTTTLTAYTEATRVCKQAGIALGEAKNALEEAHKVSAEKATESWDAKRRQAAAESALMYAAEACAAADIAMDDGDILASDEFVEAQSALQKAEAERLDASIACELAQTELDQVCFRIGNLKVAYYKAREVHREAEADMEAKKAAHFGRDEKPAPTLPQGTSQPTVLRQQNAARQQTRKSKDFAEVYFQRICVAILIGAVIGLTLTWIVGHVGSDETEAFCGFMVTPFLSYVAYRATRWYHENGFHLKQ